jgi:outer membrane protein assembly factor BamB
MFQDRLTVSLAALALPSLLAASGCREQPEVSEPQVFDYDFPVEHDAPWPQFRRTRDNNARSPVIPDRRIQSRPWAFQTKKGIFSTPVIGSDGTVYVGSADTSFYALSGEGSLLWSFKTGEVIDSAAVIGADGSVYFGSGDGNLYALDETGQERWRFASRGQAGVITWWEGNVVMGGDGTLYAGNDDYHLYHLDADGNERWTAQTDNQIWSASLTLDDGGAIFGSNDLSLRRVDADGNLVWRKETLGPVTSSPAAYDGLVVFGSFDSGVYGVDLETGAERFRVETRDHVYGSAAFADDGTAYVPSTDGSLYAIAPDGRVLWTFDTLQPIRSSPVVDGEGTIYFGGGDGQLYALRPDGARRWSFDTSEGLRDDLNASPALGRRRVIIAGEDGRVHGVPYEHCVTHADDPRCTLDPREPADDDGVMLLATTHNGTHPSGPLRVESGAAATQRLIVRELGDTIEARIVPDSVVVDISPPFAHRVELGVRGDFLNIVPEGLLEPGARHTIRTSGSYRRGDQRLGNVVVIEGPTAGTFEGTMEIRVRRANPVRPLLAKPNELDVFVLTRLAAYQPSLLPSFNQIGFDSYRFLLSVVQATDDEVVLWVVESTPGVDEPGINIGTRVVFAMNARTRGGALLAETGGFSTELTGVRLPLQVFRVAGELPRTSAVSEVDLFATSRCSDVTEYGTMLRGAGLCNDDDELIVSGMAELSRYQGRLAARPSAGAQIEVVREGGPLGTGEVVARLSGNLAASEHVAGILLLDAEGRALELGYGELLRTKTLNGRITEVTLPLPSGVELPEGGEAVVMLDLYPIARAAL